MVSKSSSKADELVYFRREVRRLISAGRSDEDIKTELSLTSNDLAEHKEAVLNDAKIDANRQPVEIFVEYQLRQLHHIDELEQAREKAVKNNQPQHAVSAVKAKAELLDKIVQRGQDLGVYYREGQKVTIKGAMGLIHMTSRELTEQLDKSVHRLKALSDDLGHPLELGNIRASLRLVEPRESPVAEVTSTTVEPELRPVPARPKPAPTPAAQPEPTPEPDKPEPENDFDLDEPTIPGKKKCVSSSRDGKGDPGPDHSMAERIYQAAMEPKSGRVPEGEISGDPAGLRRKVYATCPRCTKRCLGVQGLQRHIHFLHQIPDEEAFKLAEKAVEGERMSMAREYVEKTQGSDE
jgi:hypothetical protein